LVKRIARVVSHDDSMCERQKDGYKWGLHTSANNWWASGIEHDGKHYFIKVAYRYGHGGRNAKMMEALKTFLEWELGPSTLDDEE
jgi:hypothetical protein